MPGLRIDLRTRLDASTLGEVLALIDATSEIEGHRPVGEHKYAHLKVGASGWVGVLAYEDGVLVGYAHTRWNRPGERPRLAVEVVAHPEADQPRIAERLLDETREVLARAGGGTLWLWVHRVEDPADTVAAKLGFDVQRELAFMTRRMSERPVVPALPHGVELRPYRGPRDDEAFLEVNNAAFIGHPENGEPTLHGHSIGRWEGRTLVVDTAQFAPHKEGLAMGGYPSSTRKHLVERFTLNADGKHLDYEVVLEDPEYLRGAITYRSQWDYRPDLAPTGLACDLAVARRFLADP